MFCENDIRQMTSVFCNELLQTFLKVTHHPLQQVGANFPNFFWDDFVQLLQISRFIDLDPSFKVSSQKIISRCGDVLWPPRSLDLVASDYFLWGNLQELEEAITKEVRPIDIDLLERVMRNFEKRLQQCIAENGRHLPDIIFRT